MAAKADKSFHQWIIILLVIILLAILGLFWFEVRHHDLTKENLENTKSSLETRVDNLKQTVENDL